MMPPLAMEVEELQQIVSAIKTELERL
jgi:hypothetical protein